MKATLLAGLCLFLLACPSQPPPPTCDSGCVVDAGSERCGPGTFENAKGECQRVGFTACDAGFVTGAAGWCEANVATCDAGAWAFPGEGCSALGWVQCPDGFRSTGSSCEPILPSTPCTGATRAALGQSACVPVGDCNAAFPPATATHFVDAAGPLDATHFRTIAAALQAAPDDAVIAIAPGTYAQTLVPTKPVKLIGQCAERVTLIGSPAIDLQRTRVEVEGVTIRDSILAARVEQGASLALRHVVLDANERSGVQAVDRGSRVVLEDVVVRGTGPDPATSTFGQGVAAGSGASVSLTDVELTRNGETALFLNNAGTTATLNGVVISETKPRASNGRLGWGIAAQAGASFTATRLVVQDSRGVGILVAQGGSTATLTNTLVRRVGASTDSMGAPFGFGVSAQAATVTWNGGGVEDVVGGLVDVQGASGSMTLRDLSARGALSGSAPRFGFEARNGSKLSVTRSTVREVASTGVVSFDRSQVTLDHLAVTGVSGIGVRAQGGDVTGAFVDVHGHTEAGALASLGAALTLSNCVLGGAIQGGVDGGMGLGASASERGLLELSGCLLDDNVTAGLYVRDVGSQAVVTNSEVRGTRLDAAGEFGQGVIVEHGGSVSLEDVSLRANHTAGLQVQMMSSTLTANRVSVLNTLPLADGTRGRGANAAFGGALSVSNSAFVDNQQVGLFAFQSRIDATDTLVRSTRADPDGRYGNGLEALTQATVVFVRGAIEASAGIAAVFGGGSGVIDGVRLAGNTIALHAQDGSSIIETTTVPAVLGTQQVIVTPTTTFVKNQSKTSADAVTVPAP
ncbi:MAG: right-handed parallel beta-helix repeat-containing protein [Myxococcaceae bacterium]